MAFMSDIAEIIDGLYISGVFGATYEKAQKIGITHVINCSMEENKLEKLNLHTVKVQVEDRPTANLIEHFDSVADQIEQFKKDSGKVLVHCLAGISRSASLCMAYLMKYHKMTLAEAHALVKKKRPVIRPNQGFWKQLVEYENKLFGKNTVKMIPSAIGFIPDIYESQTKNMM